MATARKLTDDGLPTGLNVDEFLAWTKDQPGRFELHDGAVIAMSPERVGHASMKGRVYRALYDAVRAAKLSCHVLPDGVAVHISDRKWYEPDALVYRGPAAPADDIKIDAPIIVVEVVSPSSVKLDTQLKLTGYYAVESIQHYLIVLIEEQRVIHHQRQSDETILTRLLSAGPLRLDPPGIEVDITELFN